MPPPNALQTALHAYQAGNHVAALDACQHALNAQPHDVDALHLTALIAQALGQPAMALEFLQRALAIQPQDANLWNSMGNWARAAGRLPDAEQAYQTALKAQKRHVVGWINLGAVYKDMGRLDEALRCFQKAARLEPGNSALYSNWGNALLANGEVSAAIAMYRKALALAPGNAEAAFNLGNALLKNGEGEAAIACYHQAIEANPGFFEPHYQLGIIHKSLKAYEEALGWFDKALMLRPGEAMSALKAGDCLYELHRMPQARVRFAQASGIWQSQPLIRLRLETLTAPIAESQAAIAETRAHAEAILEAFEREALHADEATLLEYNVYPPFYWAFQGEDDTTLRTRFADRVARMLEDSGWRSRALPLPVPSGRLAPAVGVVVSDGHEIAFNTFMGGFFRQALPERLALTLVCSPGSRDRLITLDAATWAEAPWQALPSGFLDKIDTVRQAGFDALFYFEIGTDPVNYLMPLFRLAPVQCTSWGFPVTSGMETVDYFLSSRLLEPPDAAAHYRERLVLPESLPVCFRRPPTPEADPKSRRTFGLPETGRLYGCLQQLYKFHPDFDAILDEILRRDPQGHVIAIANTRPGVNDALRTRLALTLAPEALARVHLLAPLPTDDFLRLSALCDVLLDPPHLGGGNTTYEAFALGVPIITWPGAFMRGRITAACYTRMGIAGPVVSSLGEYAACAVALASDAARNQALRKEILAANDVLFEDAGAVRALEQFFIDALAAWPKRI